MNYIFQTILGMSLTASVAAVFIIILRWISGGRLPRVFSYAVWVIVLVRLVVPFAFSSSFSIFNIVPSPVSATGEKIYQDEIPNESEGFNYSNKINTGKDNNYASGDKDTAVHNNERFERETDSSNIKTDTETAYSDVPDTSTRAKQNIFSIAAYIWLLTALATAVFSILLYFRTSKRFETAVLYKDSGLVELCGKKLNLRRTIKVYISDMINTPVVAGLVRVRIIIPTSFFQRCSTEDLQHMITHELVHIKRYDYIIKPLSVLALCVHWFNPVVWLSFILAQKDMEMSCDEKVLSVNKSDVRSEYARSLISIAARQNVILNGGLLAFGESNIKSRIKGIMKFKKTKIWIAITAVAVLLVFGLVLLTNGQSEVDKIDNTEGNTYIRLIDDNNINNLLEHRSRYIGDASNVGSLLGKLPYGDQRNGISLQTDSQPYGITINYKLDSIEKLSDESMNIKSVLIDNALIIFSLIENVENVSFIIADGTVNFNRAEMQQYFEKDLWSYSSDKKVFEEFILDISFKVLVYPEKYSLFMSSTPGLHIDVSLNGAYYKSGFDVKYSAKNGSLLTWDKNTGKVSEPSKTLSLNYGPVYWSLLDMEGKDNGDTVTISIMDEDKNVIIQKQIRIIKNGEFYSVKPSYDVSILKKINTAEEGDAYYAEPSIDISIDIHDGIEQENSSQMGNQGVNHEVELETVKRSAQYPSTETFFYLVLKRTGSGV